MTDTPAGAPPELPAGTASSRAASAVGFLLRRSAPSVREVLIVLAVLAGAGVFAYLPHLRDGGLYSDDWAFAGVAQHAGFFDTYAELYDSIGFRPVGVLSLVMRFELFGANAGWHVAAAVASVVALCCTIYVFLRVLRVEPLHAGAIALLALVCPYGDATRLWPTGSGANISIVLWLLGVLVALRGLRARSRRAAILLHAGAVALYVTSLLQYEVTFIAICASGVFYLTRGSWRRALPRAVVDIAVATVTVAVIAANGEVPHTESYAHHARLILDGGLRILANVALPFGTPRSATVLALLAIVAVAAVIVWRLLPRPAPERPEIARWLVFAGAGLVVAAGGYALYVAAIDYYSPLTPGLANRTNAIASLGFIGTTYALALTAGTMLFRGLPGWRVLAAGTAVGVAAVIFVGFAQRLRDDIGVWDRAYADQRMILSVIREQIPELPPSSTVLTFGHPVVSENAGLPIFISPWELRGAVRVAYDDPTVAGYPATPNTVLECTAQGARLVDAQTRQEVAGDQYGEVYLIDVPTRRLDAPGDQRECRTAAPAFAPGPLQAPPRP